VILTSLFQSVKQQMEFHDLVRVIAVAPNRKLLARASDLELGIYDVDSTRLVARCKVAAGCVAFSPDSKWMATGALDGSVQLWNSQTGKSSRSFGTHQEWVRSVTFSPDGERLYSAARDKAVNVWRVSNGELVDTYQCRAGVESTALSPDGKTLAVGATPMGANRHDIELWNTETSKLKKILTGAEYCYVYKLAFGRDNRNLAVGLSIPKVRIWDVTNASKRLTIPEAEGRDVVTLSFSGKYLATGEDGGVRVWDSETGREMLSLKGHVGDVLYAAFSDDDSTLMTAGKDGTLQTWDVASGKIRSIRTGFTLRPPSHLLPIVLCFGAWLAAWCVVAYRTRRREIAAGADRGVAGFILVGFAAIYFVVDNLAMKLSLGWIVLFGFASFAALLAIVSALTNRSIRDRLLFWLFSMSVIIVWIWHKIGVLFEIIASV
jgi:WD40 repeat protein